MDLRSYFDDLHKAEAQFERKYPSGVVYVTSLFHRERNSTPGRTLSASWRNAARTVADGTHREATEEEVAAFLEHQEAELRRNTVSEQKNKRQYIVVVDADRQSGPATVGIEAGVPTRPTAGAAKLQQKSE